MPSISLERKRVVARDFNAGAGRTQTGPPGARGVAKRAFLVGVVLLMAAVAVGAAIAQAIRGAQALDATDALVFQAAGRIIAAHGCVYCLATERSAQLALLGGHLQANGVEAFNNPPLMAWLVQPVAGLSLSAYTALSVLVESAALLVGIFMAQRLLAGSIELQVPPLVVAVALVAPLPGLETLVFAQWVGLMLVALLGAYYLMRTHHGFAAGLALSLLLVKPQDIWLVPIVLLAARAWPVLRGTRRRRRRLVPHVGPRGEHRNARTPHRDARAESVADPVYQRAPWHRGSDRRLGWGDHRRGAGHRCRAGNIAAARSPSTRSVACTGHRHRSFSLVLTSCLQR